MNELKKALSEIENDLEELDIEICAICGQLTLLRMANENTEDGINEQNADSYEALRNHLELLSKNFIKKSYKTLLHINCERKVVDDTALIGSK